MHLLSIPKTCLLYTFFLCLQMILSRLGWSGYMSKMQSRTSAYNTSAVLQLPFVNIDPNNLSIMYTCILYAAEQRNKCGWPCIAITFDSPFYAMQERWFWLMGHYLAWSFGSKNFNSCFRQCVLPVPLWPEMVSMHSAYIRRFIISTRQHL